MSKSYKVVKKTMNMGEKKGQTVYSVRPVSYGTLTTEEVAKQISTESTATTADVKAVLDRYAYYVVENLAKGYNIELLGFGTLYLRFITNKAFISVYFTFIFVHCTFILEQKMSRKSSCQDTSKFMLYDYASSCRTTIQSHVVRS